MADIAALAGCDVIHRNIDGIVGMTELNGTEGVITVTSTTTFTLDGVDSLLFTTYISDGVAIEPRGAVGDANVYSTIFKNAADAVKTMDTNYGERSLAIWTLFEALLGVDTRRVVGGQAANVTRITNRRAVCR